MATDLANSIQIDPGAVRTPQMPGLPTPRVANLELAETGELRTIAAGLSKTSENVDQVAQLYAKQAGYQAVSRDSQGNLQVTQAPIVGDAAIAFHSAVKYSALALGESEAKQKDLELSKTFTDNPAGYLEAAKAFRDKHVAQYTQAAGADVGVELGKSIDTATTNNYRFLVLQQQKRIRDNFDAATTANMKSMEEDVTSLIQSGGMNTPEGRAQIDALREKYTATLKQRVQNPVLGEDPVVAAVTQKKFDMTVEGAKFTAGINRVLSNPDGGVGVAQGMVNDALHDDKMPPAQRAYNYAQGQEAIKNYQQNLSRQIVLDDKAQKARDNAFFSDVMVDSGTGANRITDYDIKTRANISPETRKIALAWKQQQDMPGPDAAASSIATQDLIRRINLPDTDPQKIKDPMAFRAAYAPPTGGKGSISYEDEQKVERAFKEANDPESSALNKQKEKLIKAAAFDKSTLMAKDDTGAMAEYNFRAYVDKRIDDFRKAGKDPSTLFAPGSADFIGKPETIQWFRATLEEQTQHMNDRFKGRGAPPPGIAAAQAKPQRQPGESIADFDKRMGR